MYHLYVGFTLKKEKFYLEKCQKFWKSVNFVRAEMWEPCLQTLVTMNLLEIFLTFSNFWCVIFETGKRDRNVRIFKKNITYVIYYFWGKQVFHKHVVFFNFRGKGGEVNEI